MSHLGPTRRAALGAALLVAFLPAAATAQVEPFREPQFASDCQVHQFDEGEAPPLDDLPDDDPLCIEYQKRDITLSTGGAVQFLVAEPARVAAAIDKCQYWQQDHWSVQIAPDTPAIVSWDGSYWFDRSVPTGAAFLDNLAIAGQPASGEELADVLEQVDEDFADEFRRYLAENGGGGMTFVPFGDDSACPAAAPAPDPEDGDPRADPGDGASSGDEVERRALPATGSPWPAAAGALLLLLASRPRRSE